LTTLPVAPPPAAIPGVGSGARPGLGSGLVRPCPGSSGGHGPRSRTWPRSGPPATARALCPNCLQSATA